MRGYRLKQFLKSGLIEGFIFIIVLLFLHPHSIPMRYVSGEILHGIKGGPFNLGMKQAEILVLAVLLFAFGFVRLSVTEQFFSGAVSAVLASLALLIGASGQLAVWGGLALAMLFPTILPVALAQDRFDPPRGRSPLDWDTFEALARGFRKEER